MQTKILWISLNAPFDKVKHAGGQTLNFYLKKINKIDGNEVSILSFANDEMDAISDDLNAYGIKCEILKNNTTDDLTAIEKLKHYNIFNRYAGFLSQKTAKLTAERCEELKKSGYIPEVIILEWTQVSFMISEIKRIFPTAKYICSEHDVVFQAYGRKCCNEPDKLKKFYYWLKKNMIRLREIKALNECDHVLVQSGKDRILLQQHQCKKPILEIAPYFDIPKERTWEYRAQNSSVVFYGAMDRKENIEAGEWIIRNMADEMSEIIFYLIGNRPPESLVNCQRKNVRITGFVEQVRPYFANSICFIAPLINGAGIKVKVLQAMAFGLPVLTNHVGIEGIEAVSGVDYLECNSKEEYIQGINQLRSDSAFAERISENGRKVIDRLFNPEESVIKYNEMIRFLSGK